MTSPDDGRPAEMETTMGMLAGYDGHGCQQAMLAEIIAVTTEFSAQFTVPPTEEELRAERRRLRDCPIEQARLAFEEEMESERAYNEAMVTGALPLGADRDAEILDEIGPN